MDHKRKANTSNGAGVGNGDDRAAKRQKGTGVSSLFSVVGVIFRRHEACTAIVECRGSGGGGGCSRSPVAGIKCRVDAARARRSSCTSTVSSPFVPFTLPRLFTNCSSLNSQEPAKLTSHCASQDGDLGKGETPESTTLKGLAFLEQIRKTADKQ